MGMKKLNEKFLDFTGNVVVPKKKADEDEKDKKSVNKEIKETVRKNAASRMISESAAGKMLAMPISEKYTAEKSMSTDLSEPISSVPVPPSSGAPSLYLDKYAISSNGIGKYNVVKNNAAKPLRLSNGDIIYPNFSSQKNIPSLDKILQDKNKQTAQSKPEQTKVSIPEIPKTGDEWFKTDDKQETSLIKLSAEDEAEFEKIKNEVVKSISGRDSIFSDSPFIRPENMLTTAKYREKLKSQIPTVKELVSRGGMSPVDIGRTVTNNNMLVELNTRRYDAALQKLKASLPEASDSAREEAEKQYNELMSERNKLYFEQNDIDMALHTALQGRGSIAMDNEYHDSLRHRSKELQKQIDEIDKEVAEVYDLTLYAKWVPYLYDPEINEIDLSVLDQKSKKDISDQSNAAEKTSKINLDGDAKKFVKKATETEKRLYIYLFENFGEETAKEFVSDMKNLTSKRSSEETIKKAEEFFSRNIGTRLLSIPASIVASWAGGILSIPYMFTEFNKSFYGQPSNHNAFEDVYRFQDAIYSGATEGMDDAGKFVTNIGLNAAEDAATAAVFGKVTPVVEFFSQMGRSAYDAYQSGASDKEAARAGIASGLVEALGEKVDIGIRGKYAKAFDANPTVASAAKHIGATGLSEAVSEGVTELGNMGAEIAVLGEKSDLMRQYNNVIERGGSKDQALTSMLKSGLSRLGQSALAGGITGMSLMGTNAVTSYVSSTRSTKYYASDTAALNNLVEQAKKLPSSSRAHILALNTEAGLEKGIVPTKNQISELINAAANDPEFAVQTFEDAILADQDSKTYALAKKIAAKIEKGETVSASNIRNLAETRFSELPEVKYLFARENTDELDTFISSPDTRSLTHSEITKNTSEQQRSEILRDTVVSVTAENIERTEKLKKQIDEHRNNGKSLFDSIIESSRNLGIIKQGDDAYYNQDLDTNISFSIGSLSESIKKQDTGRIDEFIAMLASFDDIINSAKVVKAQDDRYLGKVYPTTNVDTMHILISAFEYNGNVEIVKLEVKQDKNTKESNLYVAVTLSEGIKKDIGASQMQNSDTEAVLIPQRPGDSRSHFGHIRSSDFVISIPQILENVKTNGENFVKYFPDEMLSADQIAKKRSEIEQEGMYTRDKAVQRWLNTDKNSNKWQNIDSTYSKAVRENNEDVVRNHLAFAQYVNDYEQADDGYFYNKKSPYPKIDGNTYDDDGKLIPLSQRYDKTKNDPRYALRREMEGDLYGQGQGLYYSESGERQSGSSARRQIQGMGEDSGRNRENRKAAGAARRIYAQNVRDNEQITRRSIDVRGEVLEFDAINPEAYNSEMEAIALANSEMGLNTIFTAGAFGSELRAVGAYIPDGTVVVRYDDDTYSPEMISDHEIVHHTYSQKDVRRIMRVIKNSLTKAQQRKITKEMYANYEAFVSGDENSIFEEFVADVLSGMSPYSDMFENEVSSFREFKRSYASMRAAEISNNARHDRNAANVNGNVEWTRDNILGDEEIREFYRNISDHDNLSHVFSRSADGDYFFETEFNIKKVSDSQGTMAQNVPHPRRGTSLTDNSVSQNTPLVNSNFMQNSNDYSDLGTKKVNNSHATMGQNTPHHRKRELFTDNSVSQNTPLVNSNFMQNSKKNSSNVKFALKTAPKAPFDESSTVSADIDRTGDAASTNQNVTPKTTDENSVKFIPKGKNPAREINVPLKDSAGGNVARGIRTILESEITPESYEVPILSDIAAGRYTREVIQDDDARLTAEKAISDDGYEMTFKNVIGRYERGEALDKYDIAKMQMLYNAAAQNLEYASKSDGGVSEIEKLISAMVQTASNAGRNLAAQRMLEKMTPQGKLYSAQRNISSINREMERQAGKYIEDENRRIGAASKQEMKKSRQSGRTYSQKQKPLELNGELVKKLLEAKTQEEAESAEEELYKDVALQIEATVADKLRAWRYTSMLANPKTHSKNVVGNAMFAAEVVARDTLAAAGEAVFIKDSNERTKTLVVGKVKRKKYKALKKYAKQLFEKSSGKIAGDSSKYDIANDIIEKNRRIFRNKVLEGIRRFNSNLLEAEDKMFLKSHFTRYFANSMLSKGVTVEAIADGRVTDKTMNDVIEYAAHQAQKATFRDASVIADKINSIARGNVVSDVAIAGVMPFKKTPVNILKRGVEYSPVGLLGGVYKLIDRNISTSRGKVTSIDTAGIIEDISQGLVGTAVFGVGALLASLGVIRVGGEDEEKAENLQEARGRQTYSIEIGGVSASLDWAAPVCMPLFAGAELWNGLQKEEKNPAEVFSRMANPLLETSMMSGLLDLVNSFSADNDADRLSQMALSAASNYVMQYFPSFISAVGRTIDSVESRTARSSTSGDMGNLEYIGRSIANKVPYLRSRINKPYTDVLGGYDKKEDAGDYVYSALTNFVLPGYISVVTDTNATAELERVYRESGEVSFIPGDVKNVTVNNESKKLTHDEFFELRTYRGEIYSRVIPELGKSEWYSSLEPSQKASVLGKFLDAANASAKNHVVTEYAPSEKKQKIIIGNGNKTEDFLNYLENYAASELKDTGEQFKPENRLESTKDKEYYRYLADTAYFEATDDKSINDRKLEYLNRSGFSKQKQLEIYKTDIASDAKLELMKEYNNYGISDEQLYDLISSGYDINKNYLEDMPFCEAANIDPVEYLKFRKDISGYMAIKLPSGKTVPGSKKRQIENRIDKMHLSDFQKQLLMRKLGYS